MRDIASYYNREQGRILIEVKAGSAARLFNAMDPSPLEAKELDGATAEYIADAAREFPLKTAMRLVLYPTGDKDWKSRPDAVREAVHNYFEYRAGVAARELRELLRRGWRSLAIGAAFLFACITARHLLGAYKEHLYHGIISEGLLISGWVAMWRPIQIFLYDWWPIRRKRMIYEKLSRMEVEVQQAD